MKLLVITQNAFLLSFYLNFNNYHYNHTKTRGFFDFVRMWLKCSALVYLLSAKKRFDIYYLFHIYIKKNSVNIISIYIKSTSFLLCHLLNISNSYDFILQHRHNNIVKY